MDRQCSVRTRPPRHVLGRIKFPGLASLLAIGLLTTLGVGVARAVPGFGGGTQRFSCDVNSRICECEGDYGGADCQALEANCRKDGLTVFACEMDRSSCKCCLGGGEQCLGRGSPNSQKFHILGGRLLESPGRDPKAVDPRNPSGTGAKSPVRTGASQTKAAVAPKVVLIPKVEGKRLDWCLNWGQNCGEPAASMYCRRNGYSRAERWQQDPDVGNTWVLGDRQVCKDKGCDSFKSIACVKEAASTPTATPRVVNPD